MTFKATKIIGFAPDLPITTPGAITSRAVLPHTLGVCAQPSFAVVTTSATAMDTAVVCGSAQLSKVDGTLRYFIGTQAKLWEFNGNATLTDRSGTAYSAGIAQGWSFCAFGDVTLAANKGNTIQKATSGSFSDLASAPKAAIICNVGPPSSPFIMAFNYDDGSDTPDGWFCSGISDYTTWNSAAAQSVNGRLLEPSGPFIAAIPYKDGVLAWKKNAMYRGDYVGSPVVWQWTRVASDIGCCGKNMAVVANDVAYFADARGFWMYDGSYPRQVPGYVHDWWASTIAQTSRFVMDDVCHMRWDPVSHNLWVLYKDFTGNPLSTTFSAVFWNARSGVWTQSPSTAFAGYAVYGVISVYPKIYTIDSNGKINLGTALAGTNSSAQITTWAEGDPVRGVTVDAVRPVFVRNPSAQTPTYAVDGTCALNTTPEPITAVTTSSAVNMDTSVTGGYKFDIKNTGNYVSASIVVSSGAWIMSHVGMSVNEAGARGMK